MLKKVKRLRNMIYITDELHLIGLREVKIDEE